MKSAEKSNHLQYLNQLICLLALSGLFHTSAQAHEKNFGYLHDKNGELILNSIGECIRTTSWTAETATAECEGVEEVAEEAEVMEEEAVVDSDQDGIADSSDACPATPAGVTVDASGCEKDSDNDGVVDSADNCPGSLAGASVDAFGCKVVVAATVAAAVDVPKDGDNDGIVDSKDLCPNSEAGVSVDADGCKLKQSYVLEGVTFVTAAAEITEESSSVLDRVVETLLKNKEVNVEIAGYTDDRGAAEFNRSLSQKRAEAVAAYLQAEGVAASRMNRERLRRSKSDW